MKQRPWITFFSHTGQEIKDICNALKIYPTVICSNNPGGLGLGAWSRTNHCNIKHVWASEDYIKVFEDVKSATGIEPLITLHGWMKIVPPDVCEKYEIYNGHPALIDRYLDLKGKDMQLAVVNEVEKYPEIGSVIHRCTSEVDCGEILEVEAINNFKVNDKRLIFSVLRNTSLSTWLRFLPSKLYEDEI